MRILMTSGTGYLGARISERLQSQGHDLVAVTRSGSGAEALRKLGIEPCMGGLSNLAEIRRVARTVGAVVHTALYHGPDDAEVLETERRFQAVLFEEFSGSGRPIISCGTSRVFESVRGVSFRADMDPPESPRTRVDREFLRAGDTHGFRSTLVRLPLVVYGGEGGIASRAIAACAVGWVPLLAPSTNYLSCVHVSDAAEAIVRALEREDAAGAYHVAEATPFAQHEIVGAIAEGLALPVRLVEHGIGATVYGDDVAEVLAAWNVVDPDSAMKSLGWIPRRGGTIVSCLRDLARAMAGRPRPTAPG